MNNKNYKGCHKPNREIDESTKPVRKTDSGEDKKGEIKMRNQAEKLKYKKIFGLKFKDGWKNLGRVDIADGMGKVHSFCNRSVNIGITDKGRIFRYCKRCGIITSYDK